MLAVNPEDHREVYAIERFISSLYEEGVFQKKSNWMLVDKFNYKVELFDDGNYRNVCGYIFNKPIKYNDTVYYYCAVKYYGDDLDSDTIEELESFKSMDDDTFESFIANDFGNFSVFKSQWIVKGNLPFKCSDIIERGA